MDKQTIILTKKKNKKTLFNFRIDWKIVLSLFILAFIFGIVPMMNSHIKKIKLTVNKNIMNVIIFSYFFLIINYFILTFTITNYFVRIYKKGPKGYKGKVGKQGGQGSNETCDIKSFKTGVFKREEDRTDQKEIVDDSLEKLRAFNDEMSWNYTVNFNDKENRNLQDVDKNDFQTYSQDTLSIGALKTYTYQGVSGEISVNESNTIKSDTYLNGAVLGYDNGNGDLYSIQLIENLNKKPNTKLNYQVFGDKLGREDIQDGDNLQEDGINTAKTDDFICPVNSGIYKIEYNLNNGSTLTDNAGVTTENAGYIDGIKFYCRDIITGEPKKILTSDDRYLSGITFGQETNPSNNITCPLSKNNKPSFISDIKFLKSEEKIHGISVEGCKNFDYKQ